MILPILVPVAIIAGVALMVWAAVVQTRKARENLRTMADRLGLQVIEPTRKGWFSTEQRHVAGTWRTRTVRIYTYTTGSGKNRSTWCALAVSAAIPSGFSLKITGENFLTKAGRMLGMDDVATGDPAFDDAFYVKTSQPAYVRAALIPEVRMRLLDAWKKHRALGAFNAEGGEVKYNESGTFANSRICERFPAMLEIASDLAEIGEAFRA